MCQFCGIFFFAPMRLIVLGASAGALALRGVAPPRRHSTQLRALSENAFGTVPGEATTRLIGEGVVDAMPEPTAVGAAFSAPAVFAFTAVAAAAIALAAGRLLEPNPNARAAAGLAPLGDARGSATLDAAYFLVRWRAPRTTTYEALDSTAAIAVGGETTTVRCGDRLGATALTRRLAAQVPGLAVRLYRVNGRAVVPLGAPGATAAGAEDAWVGDYGGVVRASLGRAADTPAARQRVWDDLLQADAEAEAEAARTDVDREWSAYLASLTFGDELAGVTVIGGEAGLAPCRLCNGKGVRILFKKEAPCEWCAGTGTEDPRGRDA